MITIDRYGKRVILSKNVLNELGYVLWQQQVSNEGFLIHDGRFLIDDRYYKETKICGSKGMMKKMLKRRKEYLEKKGT